MISILKKIKQRALRYKRIAQQYNSKLKFKKKINIQYDEWFFVFPFGIGDFYLFLSLLETFKNNNIGNVNLGILKTNQIQLLDLFNVKVNRIVYITNFELKFCENNKFCTGIPIILHPAFFLSNSLQSLIGYNGLTLNDIYKIMLDLPVQTENQKPISKQIYIESAKEKFNNYGLVGCKTILIAPHANSFDEKIIPFKFWEQLIGRLQSIGYKVLLNSIKEPYVNFKNVLSVDFPLNEAIPFVEMCDNFIGARSGFCDLISTCKSHKYIIYPSINWFSGSFLQGSSLISMGLVQDSISEFELNPNSFESVINEIINSINK